MEADGCLNRPRTPFEPVGARSADKVSLPEQVPGRRRLLGKVAGRLSQAFRAQQSALGETCRHPFEIGLLTDSICGLKCP